MDNLLFYLAFHVYFPADLRKSLISLCTRSMIGIACEKYVVTCTWFNFNAIIVKYRLLFELTFEFSLIHIIKNDRLRSRVTCRYQPGVRKQIPNGCCWHISGFNDFNLPLAWSIIVSARRECVLAGVLIVNGNHDQGRFCYFGWERPIFLACMLLLCSLKYLSRMICIFIVARQYSLFPWLRNVDLDYCLCNREDHTLQYVVLSNEVGLSPFLFMPWHLCLLVLSRSR
jgi:hypothetical protein